MSEERVNTPVNRPIDQLRGVPPENVKLIKRLSAGGVAELWLASHPDLAEPFVVKYARYTCEGNDYILGQFEREYEASVARFERGISDAGIHITECDVDALSHPYLYMEYFPSSDLATLMTKCFDWCCIKTIFARIANRLGQIHRNGIVHRDIKPGNILISRSGDLRLIDFALSTIDGEWHVYHEEGMALGTPLYMSPEQAYGKKIMLTSACDWYAVGVILFVWMTGHFPFQGKTASDTMKMHCYSDVPMPENLRIMSAPDELPLICHSLLSKEPNARFSAVTRFRDVLR